MDSYLDNYLETYKELKREANTFINSFKKDYYENFVEKYGGFTDEFVCDQDLLIEKLSILPDPFECYAVLINSQLALDHIFNKKHNENKNPIKYRWVDLNEWAKDEKYENIEIELREFGQMGLVLGYGLLLRLSVIRFPLYLKEHDTEHAFYLRFSRKFQDDPVLFERSKTALEYIQKFSLNTFRKDLKSKIINPELLEMVDEIIWETISKTSEDIDESLMRAARGDLKYKYLPNAISKKLITLNREIEQKPNNLSLENSVSLQIETKISNEVSEYLIPQNPEEIVEYNQIAESIKNDLNNYLIEYIGTLPKQAASQKNVANFLLNAGLGNYVDESGQLRTSKINQESKISLGTVKRFSQKFSEYLKLQDNINL